MLVAADRDLWTANKYATDPPMDGGKTRMLTFRNLRGDGTSQPATTNEDKTEALAESLFPPPPPILQSLTHNTPHQPMDISTSLPDPRL